MILLALGGCRLTGELIAAAAGGASGAATANPAVGIAVGVAVNSGIDAATNWIVRTRQRAEQDAIAAEVATMQLGERRPWKIEHDIPIGNEHGEVEVTRVIANKLTQCKELTFSVESKSGASLYSTEACQNGDHWKWALAEPAVERWGSLQ
jgi:transcriptional accessory protein Tex/SPT6